MAKSVGSRSLASRSERSASARRPSAMLRCRTGNSRGPWRAEPPWPAQRTGRPRRRGRAGVTVRPAVPTRCAERRPRRGARPVRSPAPRRPGGRPHPCRPGARAACPRASNRQASVNRGGIPPLALGTARNAGRRSHCAVLRQSVSCEGRLARRDPLVHRRGIGDSPLPSR